MLTNDEERKFGSFKGREWMEIWGPTKPLGKSSLMVIKKENMEEKKLEKHINNNNKIFKYFSSPQYGMLWQIEISLLNWGST